MSDSGHWKDTSFGPLPVEAVLNGLGLALKPGEVMFYAHAQKHTFGKKPERHGICWPHLANAIAAPTHVGQQPGYEADSFDLVFVSPDGSIILVAISMRIKRGIYPIKSAYPLAVGTLARRVSLGTTVQI